MKLFFILPLFLFSSFSFVGETNTDCTTDALIIGKDLTKCRCCWGWMIKIDDTVYLADELPGLDLEWNQRIDPLLDNPIPIKISCQQEDSICENRIVINCLEKINGNQ